MHTAYSDKGKYVQLNHQVSRYPRQYGKTKFEAVDILRKFEVPCAPVLSMKEIANDPAPRASGTVVEVQQKKRGTYLTIGSPIKFSDFAPKITGSPLLGEHRRRIGQAGVQPGPSRQVARDACSLKRRYCEVARRR